MSMIKKHRGKTKSFFSLIFWCLSLTLGITTDYWGLQGRKIKQTWVLSCWINQHWSRPISRPLVWNAVCLTDNTYWPNKSGTSWDLPSNEKKSWSSIIKTNKQIKAKTNTLFLLLKHKKGFRTDKEQGHQEMCSQWIHTLSNSINKLGPRN